MARNRAHIRTNQWQPDSAADPCPAAAAGNLSPTIPFLPVKTERTEPMQEAREYPDGLDARNLDDGRIFARHASPLSIILLGSLLTLALLDVAGGQPAKPVKADFGAATLTIDTPTTLRNGEFFETRIEVRADTDIADATIAVAPELWRDMTINTTLPSPAEESFKDGLLHWSYGPMKAGDTLHVKVDGQINPPLFAGTSGAIFLYDGDRRLGRLPLSIRVFP